MLHCNNQSELSNIIMVQFNPSSPTHHTVTFISNHLNLYLKQNRQKLREQRLNKMAQDVEQQKKFKEKCVLFYVFPTVLQGSFQRVK